MEYCGQNEIRWAASGDIYLLWRRQMNGTHAELFTYCLFQRLMREDGNLQFLDASYESIMGTYNEPHIKLRCSLAEKSVVFEVQYSKGEYLISCLLLPDETDSTLEDVLQEEGFSRSGSVLRKRVPSSEIDVSLQGLDEVLQARLGGKQCPNSRGPND